MDSGQLSRTGEETSFFISEKTKTLFFFQRKGKETQHMACLDASDFS